MTTPASGSLPPPTGNTVSYMGELNNGAMHGQGVLLYNSGVRYEGSFVNGKRHGPGKLYYPIFGTDDTEGGKGNGQPKIEGYTILSGTFRDDQLVGDGTIEYPDGEKYVGQIHEGRMHGIGTYYYKNGDRHVGHWLNGVRYGHGTFFLTEPFL